MITFFLIKVIFWVIVIIYILRVLFTAYSDPETPEDKTINDIVGIIVIIIFFYIIDYVLKYLGI